MGFGGAIVLIVQRIGNTWSYMWMSFRLIASYKSLVLLPIISALFCFFTSVTLLTGGAAVLDIPVTSVQDVPRLTLQATQSVLPRKSHRTLDSRYRNELPPLTDAEKQTAGRVWFLLFVLYVANYSVISYFNVAFAYIAQNRLRGGAATLDDGLNIAWQRKGLILQWAILASTVGIVLKMISERSNVGRWLATPLGYAWKLGSYLVIPVLALEGVSPGGALYRSSSLIKEVWGETVISGFSFSLLFGLLAAPGLFLVAFAQRIGITYLVAVIAALIYWVLLAVLMFSAEQVFTSALYNYAKDRTVSEGFSESTFQEAWQS